MESWKRLAASLALSIVLASVTLVGSMSAEAQSGWGIAALIELDNAGSAVNPRVAFDAAGRAFAVWEQSDGIRSNILANRFVPGIGWGNPTMIEFGGLGAGSPDVAVDPNGNAFAVWAQSDGVRQNIWANRYVVGVGWGVEQLIESDDAGNAGGPRVATDAAGNAIAAWEQYDGARWRAYTNRFSVATGAWGAVAPVDPNTGGGVLNTALAVSANGDAVVVLSQCCAPADIWANLYVGGAWMGPGLIETGAFDALNPSVAMDASGNAVAVWRQWDGSARSVFANRYVPGVGWGLAALIETNPGDVGSNLRVAADGWGNAIALWDQYDGTRNNIWANRFNGATWGTPVLLEVEPGNAAAPDLAVHAGGDALAVWSQFDGVRLNIMANRFRAASGWRAAERIETDNAAGATSPAVAVDAVGHGMAVWSQSDGVRFNIWANRFTLDTIPPALDVVSPIGGTLTNVATVTVSGTTEPSAKLAINGSAVVLAADGSFSETYSGLADGAHTWVVVATDDEGNANAVTRTVTVDTTPPILVFTSPTDGQILIRPTFLVSGQTEEDARLVVRGVVIDVEVLGFFAFYMTLPEGDHNVRSSATDPAGNTREVVWSVTVDTTPPFLSLWSPASGPTNNPSVTVAGETDPGTTVLINGTSVPVDPNGRFSLSATLPDGEHFFDVNALDAAGNVAFRSRRVTVDTVDPLLTLTAPADGSTTSTPTVTVAGFTEPGVHLAVNGLIPDIAPDGSFSFALALLEGPNAIAATATDAAGNTATVSVTVTYTSPVPGLQQQIQTLQQQVQTLQQQLQALQNQLAALDQRIQDLEDDLAAANQTLQDLGADLDAATAGMASLQGQLDATNQALQDARDALAAANARLDALQTNLLLGLIAVVVILGALQIGLARMGRRRGGGKREKEEAGTEEDT